MLHVVDAVKAGYTKIQTRKVDTDVLVLVITTAEMLNIPERGCFFVQEKYFDTCLPMRWLIH